MTALLTDRRTWPAIPAVLLASLLVALGLSGSWGQAPLTAVASATAAPGLAGPTPTPPPMPSVAASGADLPSLAPTAAPTPEPTSPATATPAPSYRTYRVQSGDTLYTIAQQFHTTVRALSQLNHITDPGRLHIGEVLLIP